MRPYPPFANAALILCKPLFENIVAKSSKYGHLFLQPKNLTQIFNPVNLKTGTVIKLILSA